MKVLITEEQLNLIIEAEYTGISADDVRNLIKTYLTSITFEL